MKLKNSNELKQTAKKHLTGCWCESIGIFLITVGIITAIILSALMVIKFLYTYGVIEQDFDTIFFDGGIGFFAVAIAVTAIVSVMLIPLQYGVAWYYMQTVKGKNMPASTFFSCYMNRKHFRRTISVGVQVMLRKLLIVLPTIIIAVVEISFAKKAMQSSKGTPFFTIVIGCLVLLLTCMFFFDIVLTMRYALIPSLYAINPEKRTDVLLKESSEIISGKESYFIELFISFAGWILLSILIFPMIFTIPYITMTFAEAAHRLINDYTNEQKSIHALRKGVTKVDREDNILV